MSLKRYKGELGEFVFDTDMFTLHSGNLYYVGGIRDGCILCQIPDGILYCDDMFIGNEQLAVGPILPKSCISANNMFADCTNLVIYPDINLKLMESNEFDNTTMFCGCTKLQELSMTTDGRSQDVYVCACQHSVDYMEHLTHMKDIIASENLRRVEESKVQHFIRYAVAKKFQRPMDYKVQQIKFPTKISQTIFDCISDYVRILERRKHGEFIGLHSEPEETPEDTPKRETKLIDDAPEPADVPEHAPEAPVQPNLGADGPQRMTIV